MTVLSGERSRIEQEGLRIRKPVASAPEADAGPIEVDGSVMPADVLKERTVRHLVRLFGATLELSEDRVDAEAALERYGVDSVMVTQMTNVLEEDFGTLSKTLFFEYQSIAELAGYFIKQHRGQLIGLLGLGGSAQAARSDRSAAAAEPPPGKATAAGRRGRPRFAAVSREEVPTTAGGALDVAIIGLSGRYPQANSLEEFWHNLAHGVDCVTEVPAERWDHSRYFDPEKGKLGKSYSKWGGFVDGVDRFDPLFFNISPREAVVMDPQERLFLQCVYETMEDAGYTREALGRAAHGGSGGSVGVFVGVMYEDYQLYGAQMEPGVALGSTPSSSRISAISTARAWRWTRCARRR
ncbi:type I polyketide synthase [Variovorax sp. NFACC27]